MPVYNGEAFVAEAIASVLGQTLRDLELIVVDDGSSDRTAEIVRSFDDPRLVFAQPGRLGVSGASNCGLALCRAAYVARLDADDVMEPSRLERQLAFLSARPELGGAASAYTIIDETGRVLGAHAPPLERLEDIELQLRTGGRLIYAHPTLMMRREVMLSLGGYDSRFDCSEDVELTTRMYQAGWPILVLPERLTRFRIHGRSISATQVRRQYFCNEATFANLRAGRTGEARLGPEHFLARAQSNLFRRIAAEAKIASFSLRRKQTILALKGRWAAAAAMAVTASLLNPVAAAGVLARSLMRGLRAAAGALRQLRLRGALAEERLGRRATSPPAE